MKKFLRKIISGLLILLIPTVVISCGKPISQSETSSVETTEEPIPAQTETEAEAEPPEKSTETEISEEESSEEEISEEEPVEMPGEPVEIALSSCVILDEEYCDKGELRCEDENILQIGFNLPVGTKIYSPVDGILGITDYMLDNGQLSKVIGVTMWPQEEIRREFLFKDIVPNEALLDIERMVLIEMIEGYSPVEFIQVKKGELIGYTTEGIPWAWMGKEYNFLVIIANSKDLLPFSKGQFVKDFIDLEYLHKFFPDIECEPRID